MTVPLVLLAIPSVVIGSMTIGPMLYGEFFKDSIVVDAARHPAMKELGEHFHGAMAMALHALTTLPFWLAAAGVATAWWFYLKQPSIPAAIARTFSPIVRVLENKYYMDWINEHLLAPAARAAGRGLWKGGDQGLIDGVAINGSARRHRRGRARGAADADRPPVLVCAGDAAGRVRAADLALWPNLKPALWSLIVGR